MKRLKFIDETGLNLALTRLYGRAPKGERVMDKVPRNYGPNVTLLAALGVEGVSAAMTVEGATDGSVFRVYVEQGLAPTLKAGDIVVMDNLGAHKVEGIAAALTARKARLLYLPPYSPDLSPIEPCWSKLKTSLRTAKARTRAALDKALRQALATVTAANAHEWFRHCGYPLH